MTIKDIIFGLAAAAGAAIASFFGGIPEGLLILLALMTCDYMTGLVVAGIYHASPKTKNGRLESRAGLKGLLRKGAILLVVYIAQVIDRLAGVTVVLDAVILWFSLNEILSILENVGLMGVQYPVIITDALEILKRKTTTQIPQASAAPPADLDGDENETD
jgi:toxin secretion/phage lysis holin